MGNKIVWFNSLISRITLKVIAAGLISGFLAITVASLLFLEAANNGGFSKAETLSWIISTYFFAGIFSTILPYIYKIPLTGGHSLAAVTYMLTFSAYYSFNELITGFLFSGLLILLLGISGLFNRIQKILPVEIISSMFAGMILHTIFSLIPRFWDAKLIVISATVAFLLTFYLFKSVPPIFSALLISFIILMITKSLPPLTEIPSTPFLRLYKPEFSLESIFIIGIPLSILILSNDIVVGINELNKQRYNIENTKVIFFSGLQK